MWFQILSFIVSIIAGLGIGSWISVLISQSWEKKKLIYQKKLNLYSTFLERHHELAADDYNSTNLGRCTSTQHQLELIAPQNIVDM